MPTSTDTSSARPRVAILGLGRMGTAMAQRLGQHGHRVIGWSRSGRVVPDVTGASSPRDAVAAADVVVLSLFDGAACHDVVSQFDGHLTAATVVVNTSTIAPYEATALAEQVRAAGATYVHAPVVGSVSAVAAGMSTVLAGGDEVDEGRSVLASLGEVLRCGSPAEAASAKLLANGVLASALLAVREARVRAGELGIDRAACWTLLEHTVLGGLVRGKRQRLDGRGFADADFTIGALIKDLNLLADLVPSAVALRHHVSIALERGWVQPDHDVAALFVAAPSGEGPGRLLVGATVTAPPEVLSPLEAYVAGHATGNPAHHRRAFLPTARIEGVRDGRFVSWTLEEYCALFDGNPAADEAERRRTLDDVTVSGMVGTASMTLWHGPDVFTDVFLLTCVDGEWRIANKAYHRSPGALTRDVGRGRVTTRFDLQIL